MTRLAVNRPVTTLMVSLIVVLLGGMALNELSVDLLPDITYPTVSVNTIYEGAGPEEVETLITRPMEQSLNAVHGVEELSSTSVEGSSSIQVRFRWGADLDSAIGDIRARIERLRDNLPEGVQSPFIRRYSEADRPIMYLWLSADLDAIPMTQLAENQIMPRIESVEGVARVRLRGGATREIQINVDRQKLESVNMTVNEVVEVLKRENTNQPAGDFDEGNIRLRVRSQGEFSSVDQIANTVIRQQAGAIIRVGDIAEIIDGQKEITEHTRLDGKSSMMMFIYKQSGWNTISVSDAIQERLEEINNSTPNAKLAIRYDRSEFIRNALDNVRESAAYGMSLAVLILILFLRSFRSTFIIAVSMPLSVLATFTLLYFKGFTLNMVSFGGLALGIGLLVDNSIVVLESIFRYLDEGRDAKTAAIEGTGEVASAIVASTLTTLIVFVPLLFVQGKTGVILHQMAWVVSFSLFCSLVASLTLTPVLAAYWISHGGIRHNDSQAWSFSLRHLGHSFAEMFHAFNSRWFAWVENSYRFVLKFCIAHSGIVATLMLIAFSATIGLYPRIGTEYLPQTDEGSLRVMARMASGIQLEKLEANSTKLEKTIMDVAGPAADSTIAWVGGDADDAEDWNKATLMLDLVPRSQRERSVEEIRKDLDKAIGPLPGMVINIHVARDTGGMSQMFSVGGGGDGVNIEIRGHDPKEADRIAEAVKEAMSGISGIINAEVQKQERRPELAVTIDRAKTSLLGISVSDITQALETTIRGTQATVFREKGNEFAVMVRLREADRKARADIENVGIATATGQVVPLKNMVDFRPVDSRVAINRLDQQRVTRVTGGVEDRDLGSVVRDLQAKLNNLDISDDFTVNISGAWQDQQESFFALKVGFGLAIVLMYMVMASQFESLTDPLLILLSIPLGGVGVILILVWTGTTFNVQSFIGLIMLSGIVVNNAIVLIDYINQLRRRHPEMPIRDLILQAGVRRFRPILMTTLTTVLAMTPVALGWGEGGELQAPMARVVIGGLTSGTLITLVAIPMLALFWYRDEKKITPKSAISEPVTRIESTDLPQPAAH